MSAASPVRVSVIHDEPLTATAIVSVLAGHGGFEIVGRDEASVPCAQVVVADYATGLRVLQASRQRHVACRPRVLVLTPHVSEFEIRCALEQGVRGYLDPACHADELVRAVLALHQGLNHLGDRVAARLADSLTRKQLTMRELEVLRMVAEGASNKLAARRLAISVGTVKAHLKNVLDKLDAATRTEASIIARQRGILSPAARAVYSS
ncbi:DNA-binding response regulator [Rubrivivax sp. RP6-9]|uniref:response regulator transcription factor n=1 Tax=Rubrivivax sp. RP6-9 TaxID=3415750 RepID=UPI003CC53473